MLHCYFNKEGGGGEVKLCILKQESFVLFSVALKMSVYKEYVDDNHFIVTTDINTTDKYNELMVHANKRNRFAF